MKGNNQFLGRHIRIGNEILKIGEENTHIGLTSSANPAYEKETRRRSSMEWVPQVNLVP